MCDGMWTNSLGDWFKASWSILYSCAVRFLFYEIVEILYVHVSLYSLCFDMGISQRGVNSVVPT